MATVILNPGTTTFGNFQANGNDYILAGASESKNDLPIMLFTDGSLNYINSLTIGNLNAASLTYGDIEQGTSSYLEVFNGLQLAYGNLAIDQSPGAQIVLDGDSQLANGAVMDTSTGSGGTLTLNGTITLSAGGTNLLVLQNENLNGQGTIVQQGEENTTTVGQVGAGISFQITGGTLAIEDPLSFEGTIGPVYGADAQPIGIFGEVAVYNATETQRADFDTSTDILSLIGNAGTVLGTSHLAGDVSGLHLTKVDQPGFNYISINDQGNLGIGVGGNIPITVTNTGPTPPVGVTPPGPPDKFLVSDNSPAGSSQSAGGIWQSQGEAYSGPVAGLTSEIIIASSDIINVTAEVPNVFIEAAPAAGGGLASEGGLNVSVANGNNVLDGYANSNFYTGGTGTDQFYEDTRGLTQNSWNTVVNFHSGDNITMWGVTPSDFTINWIGDTEGAAGSTGLTGVLVPTIAGQPEAAVTIAGWTVADLIDGKLAVTYGATQSVNGVPGSTYLSIHAV